ncbi:hypothetical protein DV735_g3569, partial [Chaetothyriales sp. CBS 134920]
MSPPFFGYYMRQNIRNVRRAWDGDDYQPLKRVRLENDKQHAVGKQLQAENMGLAIDLEDNLERAIRETSVAALSTTSSRKNSTVFSLGSRDDDATDMTTPPSSPPPQLQLTPPNVKARKPTFSRKADASVAAQCDESVAPAKAHSSSHAPTTPRQTSSFTPVNTLFSREPVAPVRRATPLTEKTEKASAATPTNASTPRVAPPKQQNLVQTVLDFGQSLLPVTCPQCGMTYAPSVAEDKALHEMFHHRHSAGIELGKAFLKSAMKWCYEVPNIPGAVVVVDRKISLPGRKVVQRVLEVVNKELGSVDIKEDDLWSQRPLPGEDDSKKYDRYKAFLHVLNGKCVGICLAERINQARTVLPESDDGADSLPLSLTGSQDVEMTDADATPRANQRPTTINLTGTPKSTPTTLDLTGTPKSTPTNIDLTATPKSTPTLPTALPSPPMSSAPSSAIAVSQDTVPAIVGVSRIWTSRAFRRKGIANNLLECVMNKFIYGMDIEKTEMAFSQPTESGAALARGWFEFASPPAVPIPPASYPSSPESTRQSPGFRAAFPATPDSYADSIEVDPFDQVAWPDEHEAAIEQAQENARINTERASFKAVQRDAVKDTLSRFASGPNNRRGPAAHSGSQKEPVRQEKQTIDVDAFTRLLLTGESTTPIAGRNTEMPTRSASDSGSAADTASMSQRSVQDSVAPSLEGTSGSSIDQTAQTPEPRRRPPRPKSRYGKPTSDGAAATSHASDAIITPTANTEAANPSLSPNPPLSGPLPADPSEAKRRPPTPPLTRRKSQNRTPARAALARNLHSDHSTNPSLDEPAGPSPLGLGITAPRPPPPPPSSMRRVHSQSSRTASADRAATIEEGGTEEVDHTKSSSKRVSLNPPPLPPPRRNRASSRSSVESQTPVPVPVPFRVTNSSRSSGEFRRPSVGEARNASHAADILADLAELQRESANRSVVPPPPSDPATPNELGPGTPNSATTSMSALSVVAIKDGALGHGRGGGHHSNSTLEAERADRISRLAGLERIATARNPTVGSASATGSIAGTRTWASESLDYDADKMSESQDDGVSSVGGVSDEDKASLVGFGEGAGSTLSGPVSTPSARAMAARVFASATVPRTVPVASGQSTPMSGIVPSPSVGGGPDHKMVDGIGLEANAVDTTAQAAPPFYSTQHNKRFSGPAEDNRHREDNTERIYGLDGTISCALDMAATTQFAFRTLKGIGVVNAAPSYGPLPAFDAPQGNLRCCSYSPCGRYFAWASPDSVSIINADSGQTISTLPAENVFELGFSPLGTYIITWQRPSKDEQGDAVKNLKVWLVIDSKAAADGVDRETVGRFVQKGQTGWNLQYTYDEKFCARVVTNEVQIYESHDLTKVWNKLRVEGVTDFAVSPGKNHSIAVFIPERKGQPAAVRVYNVPNLTVPVSQKNFFKGDKVQLKWNDNGTSLLVLAQTEVDKTGKSYYGETTLYILSANGGFDSRVDLDKEGPIHDVSWSPTSNSFAVVYGYMPAKTVIFNARAQPVHTFPLGPRNTVLFSPHGRFVLVAGFGNLAGQMDIYDLEKDVAKICTIEASNASVCEWSPDGRHILTATTSPRLRVDNAIRIWHAGGPLMFNEDLNELYHVAWRPQPPSAFPLEPNPFNPIPTPHASATSYLSTKKTPSKPAGAYRPPGARGQVTPLAFKREDEGGAAYVRDPSSSFAANINGFGKPRVRHVPGAEPTQERTPLPPGAAPGGGVSLTGTGEGADSEQLSKAAKKNAKKRGAKKAAAAAAKEQPVGDALAPEAQPPNPTRQSSSRSPNRSPDANSRQHRRQGSSNRPSHSASGPDASNNNHTNDIAVTTPTPTTPGAPTSTEKKIRGLLKKIRAIDDLKMRLAGGEKLEDTQMRKIASEDGYVM